MADAQSLEAENVRLRAQIANLLAEHGDESSLRFALLEGAIENVPVGIVTADAKGQILSGNSLVEDMLGHPVIHSRDAADYGEWISFHEDGSRVESHEYPLALIVNEGRSYAELDVHYQRGDGRRFWMRIVGEPICDDEGARIGATVALIDIDRERRLAETQQILISELNHRVKNAFSVTQSIVSRTLRKAGIGDSVRNDLDERLYAYAKAHARLVGTNWGYSPLEDVARSVLDEIGDGRIRLGGPDIELTSKLGLSLSMAFYELATNAVKYGALSEDNGRIDINWQVEKAGDAETLHLIWAESGGPRPTPPKAEGFGSFVVGRGLMAETGGRTHSEFGEDGLKWSLDMPLPDRNMEDALRAG